MSAFLPPISPLSPDPPSSSIHHSAAHFTVPLCLLPPSVSLAPLPHPSVSPSSHPLPVQPPDMNSFYPLTVFPLLFPAFLPLAIHLQVLCPSPSLPHHLSVRPQLAPSYSFVWQWSGSTLADSAICVNWVLSFTAPSPPIAPPFLPLFSATASPPHPPPSLSPPSLPPFLLMPPTYIPLQAGELTFQPRAAGLNDCLWGRLRLHNPAANIWATHTHLHCLYTHTRTHWTVALCSMHNIRLQSCTIIGVCVIIIHPLLPAKRMWEFLLQTLACLSLLHGWPVVEQQMQQRNCFWIEQTACPYSPHGAKAQVWTISRSNEKYMHVENKHDL